ncbi:MAG: hypothetical protein A2X52_09095 [Candidatus Rokubacteria bacterium GWC2_70_16]|nr:MAG: hypothetical protein A2X52_09095 [Candidatus Rokubacteria bacterium GWC2_70_16]
MEPLTLDAIRALARSLGLDLTDEELAGLLPLVQTARAMMDALPSEALRDLEPASQYRIL